MYVCMSHAASVTLDRDMLICMVMYVCMYVACDKSHLGYADRHGHMQMIPLYVCMYVCTHATSVTLDMLIGMVTCK